MTVCPSPVIVLVPVGEVPGEVLRARPPFPGRRVRLLPQGLPPPPERRQHQAEPLLARLAARRGDAERLLGIAALDLFTPGLNFICGLARPDGAVALIALARLRPEFWGQPLPSSSASGRSRRPSTSWATPTGWRTAATRPA